jgi:hypothetical protein
LLFYQCSPYALETILNNRVLSFCFCHYSTQEVGDLSSQLVVIDVVIRWAAISFGGDNMKARVGLSPSIKMGLPLGPGLYIATQPV